MSQADVLPRLLKALRRTSNPWVRGFALVALLVLVLAGGQTFKATTPAAPPASARQASGYETLQEVRYVENRGNDGDSFRVRQGNREFELRLYFVDCPEKYLNDRFPEQRARVADQAKELGLTVDQTIALGQKARDLVHNLLAGRAFTVYTKWERVYDSERIYGFVEVPDPDRPGKLANLCEILMRRGLGRVHTKGADLPDGRVARDYQEFLLRMQRQQHPAGLPRR